MKRSLIVSTLAVAVFVITACSNDSSDESTSSSNMSDALNAAVSYMENALPDVSDGSVASHQVKRFMNIASRIIFPEVSATAFTLNGVWSSSTAGEKITPPGGTGSSCTEPTYLGSAIPSSVNIGDYIGMSLDSSYERCSDGSSGNYKPTIFGRFKNATNILGYLNQFLPKDSLGVFSNGSGDQALTVDGQKIVVRYTVEDAAVTTYYDKRVYVVGYADANSNGAIDGGESKIFSNLMWLRNNSEATNFMMAELGDYFNGSGSNGSDNVIDSSTLIVLNYNKSAGKMMFEYISDSASAGTGVATEPVSPNMELQRFLVESEGGAAYLMGFSGQSKPASNGYTAFAVYGPNGESSSQGTASANYQSGSGADTITGIVCVTLSSGAVANGACSGHTSAIDMSSGVPAAVSTIRAYTGRLSAISAKGITETGVDWTDSSTRANWFSQGDSVSTAFDTVAEMQSDSDGTP